VPVNTTTEITDAALALCNQPLDAIVQVGGNLTTVAFASITQAALRHRIPLFGALSSNSHDGAAVVVARDYYDGGLMAGAMAARIMRGEQPAAIPFEPLQATKVIINDDAAQAMGLSIPASLRQRATQVIKKQARAPVSLYMDAGVPIARGVAGGAVDRSAFVSDLLRVRSLR